MRFNKDKTFKIMQITDMQEIPAISPDTMKLLDAAVEAEKPDLVVYTGDQIKGYGVTYKGKGKELENAVKSTVQKLLEPVTKRGIPYAVTFGNHDRQVCISNKDQFEHIYKTLGICIGEQAEGIDGGGTYNIPIKSSDGCDRDVANLYLLTAEQTQRAADMSRSTLPLSNGTKKRVTNLKTKTATMFRQLFFSIFRWMNTIMF